MAALVVPRLSLPIAPRRGPEAEEVLPEAVVPESWQNVGRRVAAALAAVSSDSDEEWALPEPELRPEAWRDVGGRLASVFARAAAAADARDVSTDSSDAGFSPACSSSRRSQSDSAWEPCEEPPLEPSFLLALPKSLGSPGKAAETPGTLPSTAPGTALLREVELADDCSDSDSDYGEEDLEEAPEAEGGQRRAAGFGALASSPFGAVLGTKPPALGRPPAAAAACRADGDSAGSRGR